MILESERRAIVATLVRYCTAIDTGAWQLLGDVFLPNARVDYTGAGGPVLSGAETASWLEEKMARYVVLQHFVTNVDIVQDGDEVRSTAYVLAVHGYKDDDGDMRFFDLGGEYNDRLLETSAGWRISERVLNMRWVRGDVPRD
ncbi:MAG: nuclear transport factor 2 family protein [Myxococcales bacterium]|nr:MAG: nuclear transport factor 2 family protein [Myxococcales bacterium]